MFVCLRIVCLDDDKCVWACVRECVCVYSYVCILVYMCDT